MTTLGWMLQNAVIAAVAGGALMLLFRFRRPRPAVEHLLWLAITVKLVLPPIASLPLPEAATERLNAVALFGAGGSVDQLPDNFLDNTEGLLATVADGNPRGDQSSDVVISKIAAPHRETGIAASRWMVWFGTIWGGSALLSASFLLLRYLRFRRRLGLEEATGEVHALVASVAADVGVESPRVLMSEETATPIVFGLVRPCLIWPRGLRLSDIGMRVVVAHELAHLRRRDLWSGPLELLVGAIWWWYPAWWFVSRRLRDATERACDQVVLDWYPQHRRAYAEALLDVLSLELPPRPAFGLGVDGPGPLRFRLERILRGAPSPSGRASLAAVAVAVLALVPSWSGSVEPASSAVGSNLPSHVAVDAPAIIGVASRGVVRFSGTARLPELEPGGWFIAFEGEKTGLVRRLELRRGPNGEVPRVRYRIGEQISPVGPDVAAWLRAIMVRSGYDPETTRPERSATGAWVPDGPHTHRTDGDEVLALWSTTAHPLGIAGTLDAAVDREHPLFAIYQAHAADPVVVLTLSSAPDGVSVLDASIDATAAATASDAASWARHLLTRAATLITPAIEGRWRRVLNRESDWTEGSE